MMKSHIGAIALALALVGSAGAASAQTTLTESQIIQSMASAGRAPTGKPLTAALIKQAVQQHMIDNPGMPITWKPLELISGLPQINVQIQFALNSAIIRPESYATIGSMADALHHPLLLGSKFVVTGNTDTTGNRQDNLALSQARADAVLEALVTTYNVDPARVEAVGLGQESLQDTSKPTDPINRRVQLINIGPYLPGK
jgi:outer membrane protein OmpA-like peptidoglycan-associated protein